MPLQADLKRILRQHLKFQNISGRTCDQIHYAHNDSKTCTGTHFQARLSAEVWPGCCVQAIQLYAGMHVCMYLCHYIDVRS